MGINMTLIVQMLVFLAFVWFTMTFVWPPLSNALAARQAKIADGLAAAERGHRELELAQHRVKDELKQAKLEAAEILERANLRAAQLVEEAKEAARHETTVMLNLAKDQITQEANRARTTLRKQVAALAVAGAEKILKREIDEQMNSVLLNQLMEEI